MLLRSASVSAPSLASSCKLRQQLAILTSCWCLSCNLALSHGPRDLEGHAPRILDYPLQVLHSEGFADELFDADALAALVEDLRSCQQLLMALPGQRASGIEIPQELNCSQSTSTAAGCRLYSRQHESHANGVLWCEPKCGKTHHRDAPAMYRRRGRRYADGLAEQIVPG